MSRVLVVDDCLVSLMVACSAIEAGGHKVIGTTDPDEAVDLVRLGEVDAAVLDILMPRQSGFDLLKRLRDIPGKGELPVLFLSSVTGSDAHARGLTAGADDYVEKPVHRPELLARLDRLLRRHPTRDDHLAGDFRGLPLADLLQILTEGRRSGVLHILTRGREGHISISAGALRRIRFAERTGRLALLELLQATEGTFRLATEETAGTPGEEVDEQVNLRECLLEIAWVRDELRRRDGLLPDDEKRYIPMREGPVSSRYSASLPLEQTFAAVCRLDRPALHDLLELELAPDDHVRLALAVLLEEQVIRCDRRAAPRPTKTVGPGGG